MPRTIAILAPSSVPYQEGGSEKFWRGLRGALGEWSGAFAELIKVPCREGNYEEIIASYENFSRMNLDHFDMLITTKYPAWMIAHPNHVCYLQHTLRGLYDTYGLTGLPEKIVNPPAHLADLLALIRKPEPCREDLGPAFELCKKALAIKSLPSSLFAFPGPLIREIVHFFDRVGLARSRIKAWLAISRTVSSRRDYLPQGVCVKILPHPSDLANFSCRAGEYFFTASRLNSSKRVRLLVDAMLRLDLDIPLKIAGTGPEEEFLKARARGDSRIQFLGHVPDSELTDLYAGAIAVPFAPFQEDYGLVTIEAMKSGKPVITTFDSGGVCELTRDGETGLVVEPTAPGLAAALASLGRDRDLAVRMGKKARESVAFINWRDNVAQLLDHAGARSDGYPRPRILAAAPFPADAAGSGGPRRLYHFCRELAKDFAVELVCPGGQTQSRARRREIAPRFYETALPWKPETLAEAAQIAAATGESADDIALTRRAGADRLLLETLAERGKDAICVVLSHPWLYEAVKAALPEKPLLYDAHNVEADLKAAIFGASEIAAETDALERQVCRQSRLVFACSKNDAATLSARYAVDPAKLRLLPNGCEKAGAIFDKAGLRQRLPYSDARLALFVASGHKPNVDAALAIFKIAEAVPEVEFLLAGSVSAQKRVREAKKPRNAHLLGVISEKSKNALLRAADLGLNPVMSGSGVNLKSLEYLAFGLPFLSTPKGMRGLPENLGPVARICDLGSFAENIRAFFANPPEPDKIAAISAKFSREYDWENVLRPLTQELRALFVPEKDYAPSD